jgi:hypothetical protein
LQADQEARLLVLGLDNSGKTTILKVRDKIHLPVPTLPRI